MRRFKKTFDKFLDGDIEREEKERHEQRFRLERIKVEEQIDRLEGVQRLNEGTIEYVCNFIDKPAKMWRDADPVTKIDFQKMVIPNGIEFDIMTKKFGAEGLSPLYSVKATIKDPSDVDESFMVTLPGLEPGLPP